MNKQTRFHRGAPNHHRRRTKQGGHQDDPTRPVAARVLVGPDSITSWRASLFVAAQSWNRYTRNMYHNYVSTYFSQCNCGLGFPRQRHQRLEGGRVKKMMTGEGKPHMQYMGWHIIATTGSDLWLLTWSITSGNPGEKKEIEKKRDK